MANYLLMVGHKPLINLYMDSSKLVLKGGYSL